MPIGRRRAAMVCSLLQRWLSCESMDTNDQESPNWNSPTRSLDFSNWKLFSKTAALEKRTSKHTGTSAKEIFRDHLLFLISSNAKNIKDFDNQTEPQFNRICDPPKRFGPHTFFVVDKSSTTERHRLWAANPASLATLSPRNVNYFAETFKLFL